MTPEMRVRITGLNQTGPAFAEVKRDAEAASSAVVAAGTRGAAAMQMLEASSAQAAAQQKNLVFQLNDVVVSLAGGMNPLMVFAQQGSQIATIYGPQEGGVGRALKETGNLAVGLVSKFWPVAGAIGLGTAALAGMQAEINKTSDVQVSFGDVALATWQTFSDGVYSVVQPAVDSLVGWLGGIWDYVRPGVLMAGNGLIATFLGAFDGIKIAWSALPSVMGDVAISTANNVIGGVESMVNGSIDLLNGLIDLANRIPGVKIDPMGDVALEGFDNPFAGAMDGVAGDVAGAFSGAFENDYLGKLFETISGKAEENALTRLAEDADKASGSLKAANDNFGSFLDIVEEGQSVFEETRTPFENLQIELGKLDQLLSLGVISWDTYSRAVSSASASAAAGALGSLAGLTAGLSQAFEENKALSIATAVLKGAESVATSFAEGTKFGGPVGGFAFASIAALTAAANVAAVAATTKSSTSMAGGGAAGAAPSLPAAAGPAGPSIYLELRGQRFSRADVEGLIKDINAAVKDGARLQVA